jgi:hypothetical protein
LDTNVAVSALLWKGKPSELFGRGLGKEVIFFSSPPLLAELADVLSRPKFKRRLAAAKLSVEDILRLYSKSVLSVRPHSVPCIAPDPDDDVVIGTALAAHAELIVTGDRGLLSVKQYQRIGILSVTDALTSLAR